MRKLLSPSPRPWDGYRYFGIRLFGRTIMTKTTISMNTSRPSRISMLFDYDENNYQHEYQSTYRDTFAGNDHPGETEVGLGQWGCGHPQIGPAGLCRPPKFSLKLDLPACVDLKKFASNWHCGLVSTSKFLPQIGHARLCRPQKLFADKKIHEST